jgi:threonine dehydrogenase-like Zn-dependent dehydrogenase
MLQEIDPTPLITHRFPLTEAARAFKLLDQNPGEALQVILTY